MDVGQGQGADAGRDPDSWRKGGWTHVLHAYSADPDAASSELEAATRNIMDNVARALEESDGEEARRDGDGEEARRDGDADRAAAFSWGSPTLTMWTTTGFLLLSC